jgi:hypothetical protein
VAAQLWLLNVALLALLCSEYQGGAQPGPLRAWLFLQAGLFSCAASLSLLPGLLLLGGASLVRGRGLLALLSALAWTLTGLLVFLDTRIYGIFRYHFNGLVWNVLTTPGADEALHVSGREIATLLLASAAWVPVEIGLFLVLWRRAQRRPGRKAPRLLVARPQVVWGLVLLPCMLFTASSYAYADLVRDPHVLAFTRVYPLYPRFTVKRLAERWFGLAMKERPEVDLPASGILLDYPRQVLALSPDFPRPNIVLVVVDSLRADALTPVVMPHTSALAGRGRVFRDHLSSGNATRFGLFGLLYGLHGSYWQPIYHEHRSPVLLDQLARNGYELSALTSASWDFPEFRSTLWVRMEAQAEDRLPSVRPGGRDDGVAQRFEQWLDARSGEQPFFSFLLLDAPHGRYWFPPEEARFRPFAEEVEYLNLAEDSSPETVQLVRNRYLNSVHYADGIVGRVLAALERHGLREESLVIVTGDHGEEFLENGYWGHTSNFTREQVQVPLVLSGPGIPVGQETRPTSHVDLPATLLELLGADPAQRGHWTLGENLLDPPSERVRVIAGWSTLGLHGPQALLEVPMSAQRGTGIAVYDQGWHRIYEDEAILSGQGRALAALALDCRRFLR